MTAADLDRCEPFGMECGSVYSRPDAAQRYETEFLKRCGQLNWENGEPARPTEVTT